MKKKTAFISGIGGQDGSYLAELLLKKNYRVFGILPRRSNPEFQTFRIDHLVNKLDIEYGDILDKITLDEIIKKVKPNEIYHLAAQSHVGISFKSPFITTQIDYIGVINILDAVRFNSPKSKFYNASTSEIYGNINKNKILNEDSVKEPVSPYGISKLAAYHLTKIYRESYNLFACSGILFNHESPRRGLNFVTAKVIKGALEIKHKKKRFLELGNLDSMRDWGHAIDYVNAMWLILQQKKPHDFVVATGISKSVRDLCKLVFFKLGLGDYKKFIKINKKYLRPNELYHLRGNANKAKKILKWKAKISFEEMIDEMIEKLENRFF
jgi:GDPmannose 4,6-dehydratase